MDLFLSGIAWSLGIFIGGHLVNGKLEDREVFAIIMLMLFTTVNGLIL